MILRIWITEKLSKIVDAENINKNNGLSYRECHDSRYDYEWYDLDNNCHATKYLKDNRNPDSKVKFPYQVAQSHPYDDAEYYWARSSNGTHWSIVLDGTVRRGLYTEFEDFVEVADLIVELNKTVKSRMMHN